MERVKSSQIHSIAHDAATDMLSVKFHVRGCQLKNELCACGGGPLYCYPGFTAEQFAEFAGADSLGAYFGKNIRNLPDGKPRAFTKVA